MNPLEMVVAVIAVVMVASIIIKKMELQSRAGKPDPQLEQENRRLREQMNETRKRLRVLERIVTDRGADTAAQIEALREQDKISEEDDA